MTGDEDDPSKPLPMDPVALTLAAWLGLVAAATGLDRAARDAVRQSAFDQYTHSRQATPGTAGVQAAQSWPRTFGY